MTEAELEKAIAEDEDEQGLQPDWTRAELILSEPKQSVHLALSGKSSTFSRRMGKDISHGCKRFSKPMRPPTGHTPKDKFIDQLMKTSGTKWTDFERREEVESWQQAL